MKKRITELYAETGKIPTKSEYNARRANAPFFNSNGEAGSEAERRRKLELVTQKVRDSIDCRRMSIICHKQRRISRRSNEKLGIDKSNEIMVL
jgi:hypothetical protein